LTRKKPDENRPKSTMKRSDIVRKVHHATGMSSPESAVLVSRFFDHISAALSDGQDVKLPGFGTFKLREKAARLGRNPKTGEECLINSRRVLTFKPSVVLKERVEHALTVEVPIVAEEIAEPSPNIQADRPETSTPFSVTRREWIALFEVLGAVAFAGKEPDFNRTEIFIKEILELKSSMDPSAAVTRKSVDSWARLNQKRWAKWISNDSLESRFETNLSKLQRVSHKSDIIFAMVKIAVSDDDYQDLEKHLIAETILLWKIPVHVIEDVEREYADILPNAEELRSHLAG